MLRLASPLKCNERTFFLPLLLLSTEQFAEYCETVLCHTLSYFAIFRPLDQGPLAIWPHLLLFFLQLFGWNSGFRSGAESCYS